MDPNVMDALIRQAPWAAALIVITVIYLKAFLTYMSERDRSRAQRDDHMLKSIDGVVTKNTAEIGDLAERLNRTVEDTSMIIRKNSEIIGIATEAMRSIDRKLNGGFANRIGGKQ